MTKTVGVHVSAELTYAGIYKRVLTGGSVAEWSACWTKAQKGPGSNRSRDAVG